MAQQTLDPNPYDRPGEEYDGENQAAGDPSDPRSSYNPQQTPMGNPADPRGDYDPLRGHKKKKDKKDKREKEDASARQGLRDAEDQAGDQSGLYNNDGDANEASPEDLEDEEKSSGFYRAGKAVAKHKARGFFRRHKKKIGIGSGIGIGLLGGGIGIITLLLPLKVEHIVNNLQSRFFSSSQSAIREEANNMLKEYLVSRVLPGYENCGAVVKQGCTAKKFGQGPVSNLYRSWADARLETKLADKGIKFERRPLSQTWRVYAPGLPEGGQDIGKDGKGLYRVYDNYPDFKAGASEALKNETKWTQMMFRFKVNRGLVGKKYNSHKFCLAWCKINPFKSKKAQEKKLASKIFLTQRVLLPRNETVGVALLCLMQGCAADDNKPSGDDGVNGSPESENDKEMRAALSKYSAEVLDKPLTEASVDKLLDQYKEIADVGFQKYVITKGLTPILAKLLGKSAGTAAASTTADLIPIAGWINFAAQIVHAGDSSSESLKKLRYAVNGAAAVSLYMTYRTQADELHTGGDDAVIAGSFADSLSAGNHGEPTDPIVGGTAGAEQSPLYSVLVDGKSSKAVTAQPTSSDISVGSLLQGEAFAANGQASGKSDYLCNNGSPLPAGQLICPEEFLGGGNSIANGIHDFLNLPGVNVLVVIADGWNATVGLIFKLGGDILGEGFSFAVEQYDRLCGVPIVGDINLWCQVKDQAQDAIGTIVEGVTKWLIPNPFSTNMSGARTFNMMAAGADVLGNETSHTMLGGQKLTDQQAAEIVRSEQDYQRQEFERQPVFARMFSTDSSSSLISKVAMQVPLGDTQTSARAGMASLLNPVSALGHSFGSIFSGRASADVEAEPDAFGVPQYGYPKGTIPDNPEAYWEAHCSDNAANAYQKDNSWNEAASGSDNADPETGTPMNKTTNPCLLIKATIGATGGLYDTNNLTKDDLGGVDSASAQTAGDVSGAPEQLAKALVDSGRLTDEDGRYMSQIQAVANGNFSCNVNPYILQMLYGVVVLDKHTVRMSSLNRFCTGVLTASGTGSYHYTDGGGHAIDVTSFDGQDVNGGHEPGTLGYLNAAVKYLPKGTGFGQVNCGSGWTPPEGDDYFEDTCNHQHIQVPLKRIN